MARRGGWLAEFEIRRGLVRLRKTGATAPIDASLISEVVTWLIFHLCLTIRAAWWGPRAMPLAIGFTPDLPGPWYLIRAACTSARLSVTTDLEAADCLFFFEDATWSGDQPRIAGKPCLNFACTDISKSRIAATFEAVFGYPLALDPTTFEGPAVEKSEINARHDGRVILCPCVPKEGFVYQKLVETFDGEHVHDLRTPCVAGAPVIVWEKLRPERRRFSPHNTEVISRAPSAVFSTDELDGIRRFCSAIGLDWGGLDILRDRHDGRIYIVDVNKTDAGPVIALPLREKLRSTALLGAALGAMLAERRAMLTQAVLPTAQPQVAT